MIDFTLYDDKAVIRIDGTEYILDLIDFPILFHRKKFNDNGNFKNRKYKKDENDFLYYNGNNKCKVYLVDKLFKRKVKDDLIFKDGNNKNLKRENLIVNEIIQKQKEKITDIKVPYNIIEKIPGKINTIGKSAGEELNPIFKCSENNDIFYIMFCKKNAFTKIDFESIEKIKSFTWYQLKNNYIGAHMIINDKETVIYLHQYLMNHYQTKSKLSVDHINQDKLDNRLINLRLATQSEQNINTGKKHFSKSYWKDITNDNLPKYVTYNKECYDKKNNSCREFFRIENHPNHPKTISSSKSSKVSLSDKLNEIKLILQQLDNNTYSPKEKNYPLGISIKNLRESPHFILDYRDTKTNLRYNLKMKINSTLSNDDNFIIFQNKINSKYPTFSL